MEKHALVNREDVVKVMTEMVAEYRCAHDGRQPCGRQPRLLIAVGGTAMALHGMRAVSEDVDLFSREDAFLTIAKDMESRTGIMIDITSDTTLWGRLNIRDIEADAVIVESVQIKDFSVDIAAISPETLFIIKSSTFRNKDRDDLPAIFPHTSIQKIMRRAETLFMMQEEGLAGECLSNLVSEIQLVTHEPFSNAWLDSTPELRSRFGALLAEDFGFLSQEVLPARDAEETEPHHSEDTMRDAL